MWEILSPEEACRLKKEAETDMAVSHIEFLVEEPSMEAFLNSCLPQFLPDKCTFNIYSYRGKQALLRKLKGWLKGYASWLPQNYRIMIIVDMDQDDCKQLKDTRRASRKIAPSLPGQSLLTWVIPPQDWLSHGETTSRREDRPIFRDSL